MAVFNAAKREIDLKIVYYGPAMCGKTTNVQCIHKMLAPQQRGELMSLATKDDRTLFFDFLPIELGDVRGFKTRFHIYTVPGQVYYALTRRAVLTGADGVVFVVDSQANKLQDNIESLKDLAENLRFYKKELASFPFVLQYNKRDLPNVMPADELNSMLNTLNVPAFESSAVTGMGVVETLTAICKIVLKQMDSGTAKKKPQVTPGARPARPGMAATDAGIRIFANQQQVAPAPPRPAEQVPTPPPQARPAQGIPTFSREPETPPIPKPKPEAPPKMPTVPAFSDNVTAPQLKPPAEFKFKGESPGFTFAGESPKNPAAEEDSAGLIFEENGSDLSFDDADIGIAIEEPESVQPQTELQDADIELSDPEPADEDLPDIELTEDLPDIELTDELPEPESAPVSFAEPEPELSFDDEPGILIEEPSVVLDEPADEEDASGLMLDDADEIPAAAVKPHSAEPALQLEKPSFSLDAPPSFNAGMPKGSTDTITKPVIISCGEPRKISDIAVRLPLTLRLKDDSECPITVTISIDPDLVK